MKRNFCFIFGQFSSVQYFCDIFSLGQIPIPHCEHELYVTVCGYNIIREDNVIYGCPRQLAVYMYFLSDFYTVSYSLN